jgi:hypothetical protein
LLCLALASLPKAKADSQWFPAALVAAARVFGCYACNLYERPLVVNFCRLLLLLHAGYYAWNLYKSIKANGCTMCSKKA